MAEWAKQLDSIGGLSGFSSAKGSLTPNPVERPRPYLANVVDICEYNFDLSGVKISVNCSVVSECASELDRSWSINGRGL